jgi:NADH:ubiquinone oxidoreductase subunit 2 (subunit N)
MGLPPSGGFWAKWLLLRSSIESGQWWWALVILAGGLLAGGYVFRVVGRAVAAPPEGATFTPVSRSLQLVPLGLAIFSFLLGLMALAPPGLLLIGRTLGGEAQP